MRTLIRSDWVHKKFKLRKYFNVISSKELLNMAEPCYAPKLRRYEDDLYNLLDVSKVELKVKVKEFYKNTNAEKWLLENDATTNLLILIMNFFLNNRDMVGFRSCMLFYNIRQYSNLFHRNFTFCQNDVFLYTLEHMSNSHIYAREKTISNAVYHFSNQMINRWNKDLKNLEDPMQISKFIRECRHRHAQSIKSFTISYYKNAEDGNRIKQQKEEVSNKEGDVSQVEVSIHTPQKIVELVDKITIHRFVDIKALENSLKINNINKIYGRMLIKEISNHKNHDILIAFYKAYISNLKKVSDLCSNNFIKELKKIIRSKSSKTKFLKKTIQDILNDCLDEAKLTKQYNTLSIQSKYMYFNFIIFYLGFSLKNYVCKK